MAFTAGQQEEEWRERILVKGKKSGTVGSHDNRDRGQHVTLELKDGDSSVPTSGHNEWERERFFSSLFLCLAC
jgi:hypothetical protein